MGHIVRLTVQIDNYYEDLDECAPYPQYLRQPVPENDEELLTPTAPIPNVSPGTSEGSRNSGNLDCSKDMDFNPTTPTPSGPDGGCAFPTVAIIATPFLTTPEIMRLMMTDKDTNGLPREEWIEKQYYQLRKFLSEIQYLLPRLNPCMAME